MTTAIFVCSVLAAFLAGFMCGTVNKARYGQQQFTAGAQHLAFLARQRRRAHSRPTDEREAINEEGGC